MRIDLYIVEEAENVLNKQLSNPTTQPLRLKRDTNILNPVITLRENEGFSFDGFNYCYIEELGRYYFINNVDRIHSKIVSLSLEIDVLETYKNEILQADARFNRGIKQGDYYNGSIDSKVNADVTLYNSDFSFVDAETLIISTMGVKENAEVI